MSFNQGDNVVCIDDTLPSGVTKEYNDKAFPNWVKEGKTYTVRSKSGNQLSVLLVELNNPTIFMPILGGKTEGRFKVERFRRMELSDNTIEEFIEEIETIEELV